MAKQIKRKKRSGQPNRPEITVKRFNSESLAGLLMQPNVRFVEYSFEGQKKNTHKQAVKPL